MSVKTNLLKHSAMRCKKFPSFFTLKYCALTFFSAMNHDRRKRSKIKSLMVHDPLVENSDFSPTFTVLPATNIL